MSETAWLIEHPHDPRWDRESWYSGKDGFTIDSLLAVRYARKEDALREIDRFPISLAQNLRAEEHAWCGPTQGLELGRMRGQSFSATEWGEPSAGVPPMPTFTKEKLTELAALSAFEERPVVTLANLAVFALHQMEEIARLQNRIAQLTEQARLANNAVTSHAGQIVLLTARLNESVADAAALGRCVDAAQRYFEADANTHLPDEPSELATEEAELWQLHADFARDAFYAAFRDLRKKMP